MSVETELRSIRQELSLLVQQVSQLTRNTDQQGTELDQLAGVLTGLVRNLEQDDQLRERAERFDTEERDKRHKSVVDSLELIAKAIETLATKQRDLPEALLDHVERKIYELRIARYDAKQAGVSNEPAPLPPPPTHRDPTGKITLPVNLPPALPAHEDDSIAPTAAQQKWLVEKGKWLLARKWRIIGGGISGAGVLHWLAHSWHWIVDVVKHIP